MPHIRRPGEPPQPRPRKAAAAVQPAVTRVRPRWAGDPLLSWRPLELGRPALTATAAGVDYTVVPIGDHYVAWAAVRAEAQGRYRFGGLALPGMRDGRIELGKHASEADAQRACEGDAQLRCSREATADLEPAPVGIAIAPGKRRG